MAPFFLRSCSLSVVALALLIGCADDDTSTASSSSSPTSHAPADLPKDRCGCTTEQVCVRSCGGNETKCVEGSSFKCSLGESGACGRCFDSSFAPSDNPCSFGGRYDAQCSSIARSTSSYEVTCGCH